MTIKELRNKLNTIITLFPQHSNLPVRLELTDDEETYEQSANHWLVDYELHKTGSSGYEEEGELKLIGEQ